MDYAPSASTSNITGYPAKSTYCIKASTEPAQNSGPCTSGSSFTPPDGKLIILAVNHIQTGGFNDKLLSLQPQESPWATVDRRMRWNAVVLEIFFSYPHPHWLIFITSRLQGH